MRLSTSARRASTATAPAPAKTRSRGTALAAPLRGTRVLHVNATPYGGGVAEILRSEIPLLRDLGLVADWKLITGDDDVLRGDEDASTTGSRARRATLTTPSRDLPRALGANAQRLDEDYDSSSSTIRSRSRSSQLHGQGRARAGSGAVTSTPREPNPEVWAFLRPFLDGLRRRGVHAGESSSRPTSRRPRRDHPAGHRPREPQEPRRSTTRLARRVLEWIGVELDRPLITQVSRFDPWKDPLGVIAAYRLVAARSPRPAARARRLDGAGRPRGLGDLPPDPATRRRRTRDPRVHQPHRRRQRRGQRLPAPLRRRDPEVASARASGWWSPRRSGRARPSSPGRAGRHPPAAATTSGAASWSTPSTSAPSGSSSCSATRTERGSSANEGRELVSERFLLTRLLADELQLYASLLGTPLRAGKESTAGLAGEAARPGVRNADPFGNGPVLTFAGESYVFCSRSCEEEFARDPDRFLRAVPDGAVELSQGLAPNQLGAAPVLVLLDLATRGSARRGSLEHLAPAGSASGSGGPA